jgi:transposase-like protein
MATEKDPIAAAAALPLDELAARVTSSKCPACGRADAVDYEGVEVDAGTAYQRADCSACEFTWYEHYEMSDVSFGYSVEKPEREVTRRVHVDRETVAELLAAARLALTGLRAEAVASGHARTQAADAAYTALSKVVAKADAGRERHPDPSECMTGGACPDCAARDELARRTYGKAFDELPDDGPEQDYVVAALEGK